MDLISILIVSVGIISIIFVPGITLSLALIPRGISVVDRLGMSILLGLTPYYLLYFLDKNFCGPINLFTVLGVITCLTIGSILIFLYRRRDKDGEEILDVLDGEKTLDDIHSELVKRKLGEMVDQGIIKTDGESYWREDVEKS